MLNYTEKELFNKSYTLGFEKKLQSKSSYLGNFLLVTNNPMIKNKFSDSVIVEGEFEDVLTKTRDLVYKGYKLISFPLPASIRMMYSPIRTILISLELSTVDENSVKIIDDSIRKYELIIGKRRIDIRNKKDYEIIDYDLTISAIKEIDFIKCINKI